MEIKQIKVIFQVVTVISFISRVLATPMTLSGGVTFDYAVIGTTQIQFTVTYSSFGWVGFGFGSWMWTNDMFAIEASGGNGTTDFVGMYLNLKL